MSNVLNSEELARKTAELFVTDKQAWSEAVRERVVAAVMWKLLDRGWNSFDRTIEERMNTMVNSAINSIFGNDDVKSRVGKMLEGHVERVLTKAEKDSSKWIRPIADNALEEFRKDYRERFKSKMEQLAREQAERDATAEFQRLIKEI